MAVTVQITLPDEVLRAADYPPSGADALLRLELALSFFQRDVLSFGQARELAGLSAWEFLEALRDRKIPLHYGDAEYEEDSLVVQELA